MDDSMSIWSDLIEPAASTGASMDDSMAVWSDMGESAPFTGASMDDSMPIWSGMIERAASSGVSTDDSMPVWLGMTESAAFTEARIDHSMPIWSDMIESAPSTGASINDPMPIWSGMIESAACTGASMDDPMLTWSGGSEAEELVRELLDDGSGLFFNPQVHVANKVDATGCSSSSGNQQQFNINKYICNSYSGPTISDVQNALSATAQKQHFKQVPATARVSLLEKDVNRVDGKYTLKLKCYGTGMIDDGYRWRKYGQKTIKNSPNPRSYYRCTNPRCSAKRQVERSNEDPDTLLITYEGLHLHFVYPFGTGQQQQQSKPETKKTKAATRKAHAQTQIQAETQARGRTQTQAETQAQAQTQTQAEAQVHAPAVQKVQHVHEDLQMQEGHETLEDIASLMTSTFTGFSRDMFQENMGSQGLQEGMVPLMIEEPPNNSGPSSFSYSPHPLPQTPSPSLSWSPDYSTSYYTGVGFNSSFW